MRELLPGTTPDTDELTRAGAEQIFTDDGPAESRTRPGLEECLHSLDPGDTLVVTSAAHLSSAVPHFVATVAGLRRRGVGFRSLSEPALCAGVGASVDPGEVLLALEVLRRRLASLQTRAGMATAAEEGRRPGRPTVMTPERIAMAVELRNLDRPITHIARVLGVSANAVQRALAPIPRTTKSQP
ncbi:MULTISPECIES: recombinase family protein [Microbacterium]|uniref:recombinase family protein n=1 Tax=Microbacterium TaxID=33882 RepID=UPI000C2BD3AF|nr:MULTISPECIES: recombinase family protein [Microbacterium]